jgi:hypothetical protein
LNFFKNYENPLVNIVWARAVEVSPKYINPQGDTLFVVAHTANPEIHSAFVYAKIKGEEVSFSDSLQLYDDGLHFDENPSDNIWGNAKVLSGLEEDFYKVDIYTHDLSMGTIHKYHWFDSFTTAGPVTLDSISISESFGSSYEIYLYVLNEGGARTITDAHIKLICNDPWYKIREPDQGSLPNISPGEVVSSPRLYVGYIDSLFPGYFNFKVEIMSEGRTTYWIDSMQVIVPGVEVEGEELQPLSYKLEQNYPNPFNPITTIKYQIPELSFVVLKVYDVLGNEISTLVEDEKSVGSNEVEFNAANLPSGIYFYKLQAGDFMEVKKMVLLR